MASWIQIREPATFTMEETAGLSTSPAAADLITDKSLQPAAMCFCVSAPLYPKSVQEAQVSQTHQNTLDIAVHQIAHSCMTCSVIQLPYVVHIGGMPEATCQTIPIAHIYEMLLICFSSHLVYCRGCRFPAVERMGQEVLSVQRLTHGYQDRTLFKGCNFDMEKSERVALIGNLAVALCCCPYQSVSSQCG